MYIGDFFFLFFLFLLNVIHFNFVSYGFVVKKKIHLYLLFA